MVIPQVTEKKKTHCSIVETKRAMKKEIRLNNLSNQSDNKIFLSLITKSIRDKDKDLLITLASKCVYLGYESEVVNVNKDMNVKETSHCIASNYLAYYDGILSETDLVSKFEKMKTF